MDPRISNFENWNKIVAFRDRIKALIFGLKLQKMAMVKYILDKKENHAICNKKGNF